MNTSLKFARNQSLEQKKFSFDIFKDIVKSLDLTATQLEKIESAYRGVGNYLSNSDDPILKDAEIYPQGSIRLRTAVRPVNSDEFDIDLILYLPNANDYSKDQIMNAVRKHLMNNITYKPMLCDLPRGFRINYSGEYHLDITPGKDFLDFIRPGQPLWVPDKREQFKETNSKGLAQWFDSNALKLPKFMQTRQLFDAKANNSLEDIPDQNDKSILSIFVQILKRHRDEWANKDGNNLGEYKPISVLITTLATHAYEHVLSLNQNYDNEYDVLIDVIEHMPNFIEDNYGSYYVRNPSMREENYAEKWNRTKDNEGTKLQNAFKEWLDILGFVPATVYGLPNLAREFLYYIEQKDIKQINQVTTENIREYYNYLTNRASERQGGALSGNYINAHFWALEKFFEFLHHKGTKGLPPINLKRLKVETLKREILTIEEVKELLARSPGLEVSQNDEDFPTQIGDASGKDETFVGRIREDISHNCGINMWIVADNVRKGAATNSVQIAELLIKEYLN